MTCEAYEPKQRGKRDASSCSSSRTSHTREIVSSVELSDYAALRMITTIYSKRDYALKFDVTVT